MHDYHFAHESYADNAAAVIAVAWGMTETDESASKMTEVNGIKYLFHTDQPWDRTEAHNFLAQSWAFLEIK